MFQVFKYRLIVMELYHVCERKTGFPRTGNIRKNQGIWKIREKSGNLKKNETNQGKIREFEKRGEQIWPFYFGSLWYCIIMTECWFIAIGHVIAIIWQDLLFVCKIRENREFDSIKSGNVIYSISCGNPDILSW